MNDPLREKLHHFVAVVQFEYQANYSEDYSVVPATAIVIAVLPSFRRHRRQYNALLEKLHNFVAVAQLQYKLTIVKTILLCLQWP